MSDKTISPELAEMIRWYETYHCVGCGADTGIEVGVPLHACQNYGSNGLHCRRCADRAASNRALSKPKTPDTS